MEYHRTTRSSGFVRKLHKRGDLPPMRSMTARRWTCRARIVEVDSGFGTGVFNGSEGCSVLPDGADYEQDETEDRCDAEDEDRAGGAAGRGVGG